MNQLSTDVYVCQDLFPANPKIGKKAGFRMNRLLKTQLDYMLKNITNDWDFTIIIAGEGEVRVGKSTLAMQIGTYWTHQIYVLYGIKVPFNMKDNYVFNGADLIKKGNRLGTTKKYSALIFDEAGADLDNTKVMQRTTQAVKDFLRECGQYNLLNILVIPEFFDLPKGIAVSRSIAMVNCYWLPNKEGTFKRGYFKFYNRRSKKMLYLTGKKNLDYNSWSESFFGQFPKLYTLDEKEYKQAKVEALKNREKVSDKELRKDEAIFAMARLLHNLGWSWQKIAEKMNEITITIKFNHVYFVRFIQRMRKRFGLDEEEELEEVDLDNNE